MWCWATNLKSQCSVGFIHCPFSLECKLSALLIEALSLESASFDHPNLLLHSSAELHIPWHWYSQLTTGRQDGLDGHLESRLSTALGVVVRTGRVSGFSLATIQSLVVAAIEKMGTAMGTTGKSVSRGSEESVVFSNQGNLDLSHMTPVMIMNFR